MFPQSGALKRFLPLFDRVLVQRAEAASKSKGGILIPETAQAKMKEGVIVAAGPGARNDSTGATVPLSLKVIKKYSIHQLVKRNDSVGGRFITFLKVRNK